MSNNFSVANNESQLGNYTPVYEVTQYRIALLTLDTTFAVAGTFINFWFLAAILQSPEVRSRMRNQIICGMLVVNLIETMIICPMTIITGALSFNNAYYFFDCYFFTVYMIIYHIQDFVGNWYIFILICVYAAQVMNFEPKFTPLWMKIITAVNITFPWVFASLFVPQTLKSFYYPYYDGGCSFPTDKVFIVFKSLDMIVPHSLASLLLMVTAAILKYRRCPQGRSPDTLGAQLIDDRSQIYPVYPFVALLVTAVASDLCMVVAFMNPQLFFRLGFKVRFYVLFTFEVVSFLRLVLLPVMLLLLADIRERIKTWRPCRRSVPPANLVVTFEKNTVSLTEDSVVH